MSFERDVTNEWVETVKEDSLAAEKTMEAIGKEFLKLYGGDSFKIPPEKLEEYQGRASMYLEKVPEGRRSSSLTNIAEQIKNTPLPEQNKEAA